MKMEKFTVEFQRMYQEQYGIIGRDTNRLEDYIEAESAEKAIQFALGVLENELRLVWCVEGLTLGIKRDFWKCRSEDSIILYEDGKPVAKYYNFTVKEVIAEQVHDNLSIPERISDIRVKIRNRVLENKTGQSYSDWFTIPVSPKELKEKIKVPERYFDVSHSPYPYEFTAFELPSDITIEQLNQLVNSDEHLFTVQIANRFSGKNTWFSVPVDYNDLKKQIGVTGFSSDYKIMDFYTPLSCSVKKLNQFLSKGSVVKVRKLMKKHLPDK